ncbi:MAG: hypothetical protein VYA51_05175 [Planctomycetota bacterium]|nr:hypothetical protein [Planctomycetota bacterium]
MLLAAGAVAQVPTLPNRPQAAGAETPGVGGAAGAGRATAPGSFLFPQGAPGGNGSQAPNEFSSIWSSPSPPQWSGFPAFPSRLQGYGSYPLPFDPANPGNGVVPPLPAAEPEPNGWPSWVRLRARTPLPYSPEVGLLVAQDGQVWSRTGDDAPYVPSRHYDPFASLVVGGSAELRTRGGFEILLHQSTRIEAKGPTSVRVDALNEQSVALTLERVSFLRLRVNSRAHRISLPDGSTLKIAPPTPPGGLGGLGGLAALFGGSAQPASTRPAFVEVARSSAPAAIPGRVSITNYGGEPVTLEHAFGAVQIAPEQRVEVLLSAPTVGATAALVAGDARVDLDGERATCRAAAATSVQWSGAMFRLPSGATVKLRSLGRAIQLGRADG